MSIAPTLDAVFARSAGSQLLSYTFDNKELRFQLFHEGQQAILSFLVPTDTVHGRSVRASTRHTTCRMDLVNLARALTVREGRYMPPSSPGKVFEHARDRLTLAYGRRASEHLYVLVLHGEYPLLACLVRDPLEIQWTAE